MFFHLASDGTSIPLQREGKQGEVGVELKPNSLSPPREGAQLWGYRDQKCCFQPINASWSEAVLQLNQHIYLHPSWWSQWFPPLYRSCFFTFQGRNHMFAFCLPILSSSRAGVNLHPQPGSSAPWSSFGQRVCRSCSGRHFCSVSASRGWSRTQIQEDSRLPCYANFSVCYSCNYFYLLGKRRTTLI